MESVIIIGGGPAGLTAGIYCGRASLMPLLLTGGKPDTVRRWMPTDFYTERFEDLIRFQK